MGTVTLIQFREETRFNLKNRTDANVTDARINRWINAAYRHMCLPAVHRFREVERTYDHTLVLADNSYGIDATTLGRQLVAIQSVHHIQAAADTPTVTKRRVSPRNIRWFNRRTLNSGPTVSLYAVHQETMYVSQVPDATSAGQLLRIQFWSEPDALTLDADTTLLPSYYDEVLQIGSQWVAERALGYRDAAQLTKQDYVSLLNEGDESAELEAENWDFQADVNPNAQSGAAEM
jgi:hypothetical protein